MTRLTDSPGAGARNVVSFRAARAIPMVAGLLAIVAGCGPQARVTLTQPDAPFAQRELALRSGWAFVEEAGGRREILLDFPLPGARHGPRDFRLYVSAPMVDGVCEIDARSPNAAHGFLIQVVGQRKGKTELATGRVEVSRSLLTPGLRTIRIDARTVDGASVGGKARVRGDVGELSSFRRQYAADIELLPSRAVSATEPASDSQVLEETPATDEAVSTDEPSPEDE